MDEFDLETPILEFGKAPRHAAFKIKHTLESILITGASGSGKTSGSGRTLALRFLSKGYSGLVLTAKNDEAENWREYCRLTGRSDDLVIISPENKNYFNWLQWESTQSGNSRAVTDSVVNCLKTVIAASKERETGKQADEFWSSSRDQLIYHTADICQLAYGSISLKNLYEIVQTVPNQDDDRENSGEDDDETETEPKAPLKAFDRAYNLARERVTELFDKWFDGLSEERRIALSDITDREAAAEDELPDYRNLQHAHEFFFGSFKDLHNKTKSIVLMSFSGFLFRLMRDPIYSLFCLNESNVTPNDMFAGKVIVLDIPIKRYHAIARDAQTMVKFVFQRACEKRLVLPGTRPCFIYADEAMNFLTEYDAEFLSTARSSRVSTVYLAQNIDQFFAAMGGELSKHRVLSLLSLFGCKIFHANSNTATTQYASELVGEAIFIDPSSSVSYGETFSTGESTGIKFMKVLRPEKIISLNTGDKENNFRVAAYMHRQGDPIFFGKNHIKIWFDQNFKP